jgi:hypothetical protein
VGKTARINGEIVDAVEEWRLSSHGIFVVNGGL